MMYLRRLGALFSTSIERERKELAMLHELNTREGDGITVSLYWDNEHDTTTIRLVDDRTETDQTFSVPAFAAADAFDHPFCYLALPGA